MSENRPGSPDILRAPERLAPHVDYIGAQTRFLLTGDFINPATEIPTDLKPEQIQPLEQRDYSIFNTASLNNCQEQWQKEVTAGKVSHEYSAQYKQWEQNTVTVFNNTKFKDRMQGMKGLLGKLGIQSESGAMKNADAKKFYDRYFINKNLAQPGSTHIPPDVKAFVQDVLDSHTKDGNINFDELKAALPNYRWIGKMLGQDMGPILEQLIAAEAKLKINPQLLIQEATRKETLPNGTEKARANNLKAEEKQMLEFLQRYGKSKQPKPNLTDNLKPGEGNPLVDQDPRVIANSLIDINTGEVKNTGIDLSPRFAPLLEAAKKMIAEGKFDNDNNPIILSDVASEMIQMIAEKGNRDGKEYAFVQVGVDLPLPNGKFVKVVAYVVPASDFSIAAPAHVVVVPEIFERNAEKLALNTKLEAIFTQQSKSKDLHGDVLGINHIHPEALGARYQGQPSEPDFISVIDQMQEDPNQKLPWGPITFKDGKAYMYLAETTVQTTKPADTVLHQQLPDGTYIVFNPAEIYGQHKDKLYQLGQTTQGNWEKMTAVAHVGEAAPRQRVQLEPIRVTPEQNLRAAQFFCDNLRTRIKTAAHKVGEDTGQNLYEDPVTHIRIRAAKPETIDTAWFDTSQFTHWAENNNLPLCFWMMNGNHAALLLQGPQKGADGKWRVKVYNPNITGPQQEYEEELQPPEDLDLFKYRKRAEYQKYWQNDKYIIPPPPNNDPNSKAKFGTQEITPQQLESQLFMQWFKSSLPPNRDIIPTSQATDAIVNKTYDLTLQNDTQLHKDLIQGKIQQFQFDGWNCIPISFYSAALRYAAKSGDNEFKQSGLQQFSNDFDVRILTRKELLGDSKPEGLNSQLLEDLTVKCLQEHTGNHKYALFGEDPHPEWGRNIPFIKLSAEEIKEVQEMTQKAQVSFNKITDEQPLYSKLQTLLQQRRAIYGTFGEASNIIEDPNINDVISDKQNNVDIIKVPPGLKDLYELDYTIDGLITMLNDIKSGAANQRSTHEFGKTINKIHAFIKKPK